MSHFPVLILVEEEVTRDTAEDVVTPLLAPYDENGECFREGSRWDWWQIGGRWTGAIADGYEPADDIANYEQCDLCAGTGRRADWAKFEADSPGWLEWSGGCNGCMGKGQRQKWPTQWAECADDVRRVSAMQFKTYRWVEDGEDRERTFIPTAIVTPDGKWHEQTRMGWWGISIPDEDGNEEKPEALWRATVQALIEQHPDAYAIVVDCHV